TSTKLGTRVSASGEHSAAVREIHAVATPTPVKNAGGAPLPSVVAEPAPVPAASATAPSSPSLHTHVVARAASAKTTNDDTAAPEPIAAAAPAATATPASMLADEVRALASAKLALNAGDAAGALDGVHAYQARYPRGLLAPEALYLEMEARARLGQNEA